MGKLIFRYGPMGSAKTAQALILFHDFISIGQNVLLLKPKVETRDGETKIKSRIGIESGCEIFEDYYKKPIETLKQYDLIIIDEVQFLSTEQIDWLADIVDENEISVVCYGLRTDFTGHLFDGSKRLMEVADVIERISTICWCGKKAVFNARVKDGKIVKSGEQISLGGDESYRPLCRKHYIENKIQKESL